jgi:hypothetical protein
MQCNHPFLQQIYLQTSALARANQIRAACILKNGLLRHPFGYADCHQIVADRQADQCLATARQSISKVQDTD